MTKKGKDETARPAEPATEEVRALGSPPPPPPPRSRKSTGATYIDVSKQYT